MTLRSELHGQELVAVKDGDSAEALRHEAAILRDLDHPGIIGFVALTDDDRGPCLLTRYAGRETLATWQPQRLEEFRRVVEELAEAVRHLHEQAIVHRAIRPAHVVIDSLRRPQLCGFSAARRLAGDGTAEQLADVAAIGETALATLQRLEAQKPRPGLRRDEQRLRHRLRAVAHAAADGRVPSARALAGRIRAAATETGAPPVAGAGPHDEPPAPDALIRPPAAKAGGRGFALPARLVPRRRAGWLAAAAVGAGCALGTLMVLHLGDESAEVPTSLSAAALGSPAATRPTSLPAPAVRPAPEEVRRPDTATGSPDPPDDGAAGCRAPAGGSRDVDGDGCAEQVHIAAGFVSVDGRRYPVGTPGDQVAVGDWDCDGVATVAVVQPGGQVYLFDSWPLEAPLVGTLIADLLPPVKLADVARGACNELTVHYAEGTWYLPLPSASG